LVVFRGTDFFQTNAAIQTAAVKAGITAAVGITATTLFPLFAAG